jgi:sporulation protein YlmC with PRC-barrel domain
LDLGDPEQSRFTVSCSNRRQTGLATTEKGVPMSGFDIDDVPNWRGRDVIDQNGHAVGVIADIYVDDVTGRPEWAAVKTGLFSHRVTFVPLSQATLHGLRVQVPYGQSHLHDAPNIDPDGNLSADEEARLYQHYGLDYGPVAPGTAPVGTTGPAGPSGTASEFVAPATDRVDEEGAMGTREGGRLRLRKHMGAGQDPDRTRGD